MIRISWAGRDDTAEVVSFFVKEMWEEVGKYLCSDYNLDKVIAQVLHCIDNDGVLVARSKVEIVGILALCRADWWFSDEEFLADNGFYVLPEYRSAVGVDLITTAKTRALELRLPLYIRQAVDRRKSGRVMDVVGFETNGRIVKV